MGCTPEKCERPQLEVATSSDTMNGKEIHTEAATVGEGSKCNPSLPPAFAITCAVGLYCEVASSVFRGAEGVCTKCTPEKCEQPQLEVATSSDTMNGKEIHTEAAIVGEGSKCSPDLPPAF